MRNQRQRRQNQDLNPLEVPAEKEDKKTADEDRSLNEENGGDENGFGGVEIFNNSFGGGDNFEQPHSSNNQKKNINDLEEEKGDPMMISSEGDKQAVSLNL